MNRRNLLSAGLAGTITLPHASAFAGQGTSASGPFKPDASIKLWPGEAPGLLDPTLSDSVRNISTDPAIIDRWVERVRHPRLDVFKANRPNGGSVLIMPGGGYRVQVIDKEGYEPAAWLAARGITAFVLTYRLPNQGWKDRSNAPLADAQRAIRVIRAQAATWGIDPLRVAAMGFSAGGHLCADLAARFDREVYAPVDSADAFDPRPMLAAPIYPVVSMDPAINHAGSRANLLGESATPEMVAEHSVDRQVTAATPPCFLVHAEDDPGVKVANTVLLRTALRAARVPVEAHLFESGGHGFGIRLPASHPTAVWPDLFWAWANAHGWLCQSKCSDC